jgi:glycosyltransferase involved in cell wall biosynthesis
VITGKMSYHANVTAVVRFVEDVMPLIWAQLPEVRLWIVGKDPAPQIRKLGVHVSEPWAQPFSSNGSRRSRVQITGTVPDIRPFLRRATVAVAPIRYGAGIQNKVLEAFACGTPVVATPEAVTALGARHGTEMLVGASPRELADGVVGLMRDPTRRAGLGEAARAFVLREHGRQALARSLAEVYREARG